MKNAFKFPMNKAERVLGCVYIPVHAVLPFLISLALRALGLYLDNVYFMLVYYTLSFIFVLMIAFRFLRKSIADLIESPIRAVQSVILGYAFFYVMMLAVAFVLSRLITGQENPNTAEVMGLVRLNKLVMTVVSVVLAPIVEETLFRGALFGSLRQKSRLLAYIISALLFSIYHLWQYAAMDFSPALLLFCLQYIAASIALAWCYERGGTILAPILLHAVINFISTRLA